MLPNQAPSARRALGVPRTRQSGVATLIIVMSLFFVVSLVAAYASRNLIFEQRTSANQYRSTQAFEAAESGAEWALAMLNAGRLDAACVPTNNAVFSTLRERLLIVNPDTGVYRPATWIDPGGANVNFRPTCVRDGTNWSCSCPTAGAPVLAAPAGDAAAPAFRLRVEGGGQPGTLRIVSIGCTSLNEDCLERQRTVAGDAVASVIVSATLAQALPTSPPATVTVRGDLTLGAATWHIANADAATNGITVNTGGNFTGASAVLHSVPGTPGGNSFVAPDTSLSDLVGDRMFISFFGVKPSTFKRQPAVVQYTCGGGCSAGLRDIVDRNPGRPIWVIGDLTLDADVVIGAPNAPVLLFVEGDVSLATAGVRVHGIVYTQAATAAVSGAGVIEGAFIAQGHVNGASDLKLVFDAGAMTRLRQTFGSIVRLPGGWRDI